MNNYYPFQGKNLFEEPEYYFYSDCLQKDYIKNWKNFRLNKLKLYKKCSEVKGDNIFLVIKENSLLYYLELVKDSIIANTFKKKEKFILDKFIRKFEVHRRLFSYYDSNYIKLKTSKLASLYEYIFFAEVLTKCLKYKNGLYYLSTLIKLLDCILSIQENNFSKKERRIIIKCIKLELFYVRKLYNEN